MPSINTKLLGEVEVAYPSQTEQQKIVALLSALDDKIEINQKINDNLAELLQAVYQERFGDVSAATELGTLSDISPIPEIEWQFPS